MREIIKFGNPALKQKCYPVEKINNEINILIKSMADTMYESEGVGLAAIQIGILKQILVYDIGEGLNVLINPKIIKTNGTYEEEEGCLSVPEVRVPVKRYEFIEVEGLNEKGEKVVIKGEGLLARVLQHEVDHLNGKIILDRTSRKQRNEAIKELNDML